MSKNFREWLVAILIVTVFSSSKAVAQEVQRVETNGTIGFTGVYEPVGIPDPTPSESILRPSIPEVAKPVGSLPKTNDNVSYMLLWLGIFIISFAFLLWKRQKKQIQNKNNKKAGIIS